MNLTILSYHFDTVSGEQFGRKRDSLFLLQRESMGKSHRREKDFQCHGHGKLSSQRNIVISSKLTWGDFLPHAIYITFLNKHQADKVTHTNRGVCIT